MKVIFAVEHTDAAGRNYHADATHNIPDPQARNLLHRGIVREAEPTEAKPRGRTQPPPRVDRSPKKAAAKTTTTTDVVGPAPAGTPKKEKEGTGRG